MHAIPWSSCVISLMFSVTSGTRWVDSETGLTKAVQRVYLEIGAFWRSRRLVREFSGKGRVQGSNHTNFHSTRSNHPHSPLGGKTHSLSHSRLDNTGKPHREDETLRWCQGHQLRRRHSWNSFRSHGFTTKVDQRSSDDWSPLIALFPKVGNEPLVSWVEPQESCP